MLRVASNALIIPPFECAWLSLNDYQLNGSCCLQFECKGENDVTIILKPFPGAKRWQHLQRQQAPAGGEQFAVEANYTVILGSHRNSKLKIEKNGDEKAVATGLPGCVVNAETFTAFWINYSSGSIAIGTGPVGSSLSYLWHDPEPPIADIQHIGLSCWDKHVSYRDVQLLPALAPAHLLELQGQLQHQQLERQQLHHQPVQQQQQPQQQGEAAALSLTGSALDPTRLQWEHQQEQAPGCVAPLLQLVQSAIVTQLQPGDVCHMLQLSEALLPRTQALYGAAVQLAGEWLEQLAQHHLQELAMLPMDVLIDVLHEPLLDVSELSVFQAVAAWCQAGTPLLQSSSGAASTGDKTQQQGQQVPRPELQTLPQRCAPMQESVYTQPQQLLPHAITQPAQRVGASSFERQQVVCSTEQQGAMQQLLGQEQAQEHGQQQQVCLRPPSELREVLQLVRFALMSEPERQAVLSHPFTRACPLVEQCMQQDLQQLQDYHSRRPSPTARAGFSCQQRRLLLPARAALQTSLSSVASGSEPLHPSASIQPGPARGSMAGRCNSAPMPSTITSSSSHVAEAATDGMLQQQTAASSNTTSKLPSGWLAQRGSSAAGAPNGWRSYRRRLAPSCKELMYVCDGDRNGVIHYIATEYGSKPWVNPVLSKAVDIKASSPPSRYTDPKAIVSGQFLNTSFAGPRYMRVPVCQSQPVAGASPGKCSSSSSSNGAGHIPTTWWQVDLGPQHRLLCNYYVIRHDGSQEGFARSWALQGSNDLQHWLDLRRHVDDSTLRLAGQYGSWPVAGPAACMPFRAFRLVLLGPTQSQTNPWAFCLSYWELYGYFYKLRNAGSSVAAMAPQAKVC